MSPGKLRKCPTCGKPVPAGKSRCRDGHKLSRGAKNAPEAVSSRLAEGCPADEKLTPLACGERVDTEIKKHVQGCSRCRERLSSLEEILTALQNESSSRGPETPTGVIRLGENSLFECQTCQRLVETQYFEDKYFVPRFCPWCGLRVSAILGRELDGCCIDGLLSQGGFGAIYLASNVTQPMMKSVVKVLRPQVAYFRPEFIKVFLNEARITESIGQTCWNIVRVSNVREKPWPYFFMEYIRGTTLEVYIAEQPKNIPIPDCIGFLRGMAKALVATHQRGRVHRDLKPLNIMVNRSRNISQAEDRIKMLDFGLAMKIAGKQESLGLSGVSEGRSTIIRPGEDSPVQSAGTPEYMAPEAFDGVNDFEGDLYAFGVTAYEILAGKRPWRDAPPGTNRMFYWRNCHKNKPPRPVRAERSEVPKWLGKVVMGCLEKDPNKRIGSAEELLGRLKAPLPRWVWLAAAAALLLVSFVAVRGFLAEAPTFFDSWEVLRVGKEPGKVRGRALTLHVRGPQQLSDVRLHAVFPAGIEGDYSSYTWDSGQEFIRFETVTDKDAKQLEIFFVPGEPSVVLPQGPVEITGTRRTLLKTFVVRGSVTFEEDTTKPMFRGKWYMLDGDPTSVTEVQENARINPERVWLLCQIEDESSLDEIVLHVGDERLGSVPFERVSGKDESLYRISLEELKSLEGECEIQLEARDEAGNSRSSPEIRLLIDTKCHYKLSVDHRFLADGRCFSRLNYTEEYSKVFPYIEDPEKPLPCEFFPAHVDMKSIDTALDMVHALDDSLGGLSLSELEKGEEYYLAIPVREGARQFGVTLHLEDAAFPTNSEPVKIALRGTWFRPLSGGDISRLELTLTAGAQGARPKKYPFESMDLRGTLDGVSPRRVNAEGLSPGPLSGQLVVGVAPGRILRASCNGQDGKVSSEAVIFEGLLLRPNESNELALRFRDGLNRPMEKYIVVYPDTELPSITLESISNGKPNQDYHDVESGKEITVRLISEEDLRSATVKVKGLDRRQKLDPKPREDGAYVFEGRLANLALHQGRNELNVNIVDLAGLARDEPLPLVLDKFPPVVEHFEETDDGGRLELRKDRMRLRVTDANGIDFENSSFFIRLSMPQRGESPVTIEPEDPQVRYATVAFFNVNLETLEDHCRGEMRAEIADRYGKVATDRFSFVFRRHQNRQDVVPWKDLVWIRFTHQGKDLYISSTEISNSIYSNRAFIGGGKYIDSALRKEYKRPGYWREDGSYPDYLQGTESIRGDRFPVVGISPDEAEKFASVVFGARLPSSQEWLSAARMDYDNGRFPWPDKNLERDWINCRSSSKRPASRLVNHFYKMDYTVKEKLLLNSYYVPVDQDPFPVGMKDYRSCAILHQLGNVAELVRDSSSGDSRRKNGGYVIVGGHMETPFERITLKVERPERYRRRNRIWTTGFRLLMDPAEAPKAFQDAARGSD